MHDSEESLKLNRLDPIEVISKVEVHADLQSETGNQIDDTATSYIEIEPLDTTAARISEDLNSARAILEMAKEKLSDSAKTVTEFGSLEKGFFDIDKLSGEIEVMEVAYFVQREARARSRLNASLSYLDQKKEELSHLKKSKGEIEASLGKIRESESEAEARSNLVLLKSKLEEETTELLKTEVVKSKMQNENKLSRESLGAIKIKLQHLNKKLVKVENAMEAVLLEVQKGSKSVEELELALQGVIQEKETLVEIGENGKTKIESLILEYQQQVF
ncbi:hypothetical protein CRYUN_Cryun25bG0073600 [Craigia yunnanensis]